MFVLSFRIMSKHFKVYITITDIVGEKRIDLVYSIKSFDSSKKVAVVSMFSDNIQYKFMEPWTMELELGNTKLVITGTYTRQELINPIKGKIEITQFDKNSRIKRTKKLEGIITEVVFSLDELDNTNNRENRKPSNTLFTYHLTACEDSTYFEPYIPLSIRNLRTAGLFP